MKNIKLLFTVLLLSLICCTTVLAEDTHYTCSSVVSDFDGKTFENLYLDVEGCGASLEFTDLTVTGNLIYDGGRDTEDHYITFTRPSIESMYAPCEPTHECHFIFNGSEDIEYVANEMTVLPSGNEKGKIFIQGNGEKELVKKKDGYDYSWSIQSSVIKRLNFINGTWSNIITDSFLTKNNIPSSMPDFSSLEGSIEIDLDNIMIEQMSVVNLSDKVVPSISMKNVARIKMLATYTSSLKIYEPEKTNEFGSWIASLISAMDGEAMELSLDHVQVSIYHVFGGNNEGSTLKLKSGFEKMHDSSVEVVQNLFLFGANLDLSGYNLPNRDNMTVRRLVVVEQTDEYNVTPSPSILNNYLNVYNNGVNFNNEYLDCNDYEKLLDLNMAFQTPQIRLLSNLSQQYAVNHPNSETHWKPSVTLSYVNVGKAICAQSIANEVPALTMSSQY